MQINNLFSNPYISSLASQSAGNVNQLEKLKARDREVRTHEQAHQAAAGTFSSSPVYNFQKGSDGNEYAIGGHVAIQMIKDKDPNITIKNAAQVRRAALAPASPSSQDYYVAFKADVMSQNAKNELNSNKSKNNEVGNKLNVIA